MLKRIFTAAIFAGALSGAFISAVQEITTTPLILHAEQFESGETDAAVGGTGYQPANFVLVHGAENDGDEAEGNSAWAPEDGLERSAFSLLSNVITGVGFALVLVGCFSLYGKPVSGRQGAVWGIAGFSVVALAPGLGLPPELPGMFAADLVARQTWWFAAALSTAGGLWLMVFRKEWLLNAVGVVLLALPHLVGAPHPAEIGGNVPPELAGHFVAASLVTAAIFWAVLGWSAGIFYSRQEEEGAA